jgi:hypothetical protein
VDGNRDGKKARKRTLKHPGAHARILDLGLIRGSGFGREMRKSEPGCSAMETIFRQFGKLAEIGTTEILHAETVEDVRGILSVIAIEKGLRVHGRFLVNYSEAELMDIESRV